MKFQVLLKQFYKYIFPLLANSFEEFVHSHVQNYVTFLEIATEQNLKLLEVYD